MDTSINQAVVFTKPLHHLGIALTPDELAERTRTFLSERGFRIVYSKKVTGPELAEREIIRQHYLMYSEAACVDSSDELKLSDGAKAAFESAFGKSWASESGKVLGSPRLQQEKGISTDELFLLWNDLFVSRQTQKIGPGLLIARLSDLDCYCINAFYPAMEENFYNPATSIDYYVVEFDPDQVSWEAFRKEVLGVTNAANAAPDSFRGQLYAKYKVDFPGRDNFVHGSAGPLEGLVERVIHEPGFAPGTNPVGRHLETRGISLEHFKAWRSRQSIADLGAIFDATEELNTDQALPILDAIAW
jgi:nucleoside diphosphate kinase